MDNSAKILAVKLYDNYKSLFMEHPNRPDLKVLIIDDEGDICYLLSSMLKQRRIKYDHVYSLAQAVVALKESTPSIILLDNKLPDGQGIGFIEFIRTNYPESKVVVITAHESIFDKQKAFKKGADRFINKPFTRQEIYDTIEELCPVAI